MLDRDLAVRGCQKQSSIAGAGDGVRVCERAVRNPGIAEISRDKYFRSIRDSDVSDQKASVSGAGDRQKVVILTKPRGQAAVRRVGPGFSSVMGNKEISLRTPCAGDDCLSVRSAGKARPLLVGHGRRLPGAARVG